MGPLLPHVGTPSQAGEVHIPFPGTGQSAKPTLWPPRDETDWEILSSFLPHRALAHWRTANSVSCSHRLFYEPWTELLAGEEAMSNDISLECQWRDGRIQNCWESHLCVLFPWACGCFPRVSVSVWSLRCAQPLKWGEELVFDHCACHLSKYMISLCF